MANSYVLLWGQPIDRVATERQSQIPTSRAHRSQRRKRRLLPAPRMNISGFSGADILVCEQHK